MSRRRRGQSGENPISLFSFQDILLAIMGLMIFITLIMSLELTDAIHDSAAVQAAQTAQEQDDVAVVQQKIVQLQRLEASLSGDLQKRVQAARDQLHASRPKDPSSPQSAPEPVGIPQAMTQFKQDLEKLRVLAQEVKDKSQSLGSEKDQIQALLVKIDEAESQLKKADAQLQEAKGNPRISYILQGDNKRQPVLFELSGTHLRIGTPNDSDRMISIPTDKITDGIVGQVLKSFDKQKVFIVVLLKPSGFPHYKPVVTGIRTAGFESGRDLIDENTSVLITPDSGTAR
jgi:hypothetical protein